MYNDFVKFLDSIKYLDKKAYEAIKNIFGEETDSYFEEYILSIDENDYESYNKVDYYIKLQSSKFDASNIPKNVDLNIMIYLKQINDYPVLDEQQEIEQMSKIRTMEDELKIDNIDDKKLDSIMVKYDYNKQIGHNLESRKIQLKYLCKIKNSVAETDFNIFKKYVNYIDTKEYFYNCNLRLVYYFAKRRAYNTSNLSDSIQNGNIGLMKVIDKFDISKGTKFSTYAAFWINNHMIREYRYNNSGLKVSYNMLEVANLFKRFRDAFYNYNGFYPAYDDSFSFFYKKMENNDSFINKSEIEKKEVIDELIKQVEMIIYREYVTSLNSPVDYEDSDESELIDYIADNSVDIEESINNSLIETELKKVLEKLPNRKICVLLLRNGIKISKYLSFEETKEVFSNLSDDEIYNIWNRSHYLTQKEVAELLSVTHQRIGEMESSSKKKIRKYQKRFIDYLK